MTPITLEAIDKGRLAKTLDGALADASRSLVRACDEAMKVAQNPKGLKSTVTLTVTIQRQAGAVYDFKGVVKVAHPTRPASIGSALHGADPETGEWTLVTEEGGGDPRPARLTDDEGPSTRPGAGAARPPSPTPSPSPRRRSARSVRAIGSPAAPGRRKSRQNQTNERRDP